MKRSLRFVLYFIVGIAVLFVGWKLWGWSTKEGFQAASNARPSREASAGETSCNSNEEYILGRCYSACPGGQAPTGNRTTCPVPRQSMAAVAGCPSGYLFNTRGGVCVKQTCDPDPDTGETYTVGTDAQGNSICIPAQIQKKVTAAGSYTPAYNVCYNNGSVPIRYIRIKPLKTSTSNKLCINKIEVLDDKNNPVKPLSASASDGKCILNPIGVPDAQCQSGQPFTSGVKYDSDADGGQASRAANSYWLLDLGAVTTVKQIQITQCGVRSPETSLVDGLRLEVFGAGGVGDTPMTTRVLGPETVQTVVFNFNRYDANSEACFDVCPVVGTVQSKAENGACIVSVNGITNRSLTEPMVVSQAVKLPCNSQYLRAQANAGNPLVYVNDFKLSPADNNKCLSCSAYPGTVMLPLVQYNYTVGPGITPVQTFQNLAQYDVNAYTNLTSSQKTIMDNVCPVGRQQTETYIGCRTDDNVDSWHWGWPKQRCRKATALSICVGCDRGYDNRVTKFCKPMKNPTPGSGTTQLITPSYTDTNNLSYICVTPIQGSTTTYKCPPYSIVVGDQYKPICLNLLPFMVSGNSGGGWNLTAAGISNWGTNTWVTPGSTGDRATGSGWLGPFS